MQNVLCCYRFKDVLLGRLLDLAAHQQLVEDEVGLLEVEDDVELAHLGMDSMSARLAWLCNDCLQTYTSEVLVQQLHVPVDDFQRQQLVVVLLNGAAEVQAGVPTKRLR